MNTPVITLLIIALLILALALLLLSVRLFFRKEVAIESSCCSTGKYSDTKKSEHHIPLDTDTCNGGPLCCRTM